MISSIKLAKDWGYYQGVQLDGRLRDSNWNGSSEQAINIMCVVRAIWVVVPGIVMAKRGEPVLILVFGKR